MASLASVLALGGLLIVKPRMAAATTDEAVEDAGRIKRAVEAWQQDNGEGCPTISQLIHEKRLDDSARTDDPWGERYRVRCSGSEITVFSPGEDGKVNTDDDIRVSLSASKS